MKKLIKISRARTIQKYKALCSKFEIDPFLQLVSMEKKCFMIEFGRPVDEPSSAVLNFTSTHTHTHTHTHIHTHAMKLHFEIQIET